MPFKVTSWSYVAFLAAIAALGAVATIAVAAMVDAPGPEAPVLEGTPPATGVYPTVDSPALLALLGSMHELEQFGHLEEMELRSAVPWYHRDSLLGAQFALVLPEPLGGSFEFIVSQWLEDEAATQPYERFRLPLTVSGMDSLWIALDTENEVLAELTPGDGTEIISQGTLVPEPPPEGP
ncbi:MAG: hypothetical protein ACE5EF_01675 [Dehalococcoidia bacterium]